MKHVPVRTCIQSFSRPLAILFLGWMVSHAVIAQTHLPTAFDFETAPTILPDGWTTNTTSWYAQGHYGKAGKMANDGHFFQLFTVDHPGRLMYYLKGFGNSTWEGSFAVEESTDGTNWNIVHAFNDGSIHTDSYVQYMDTLNRNSKYVRFHYVDKVSGSNLGIDEVSLDVAPPSAEAEIQILFQDEAIPSNGQIDFRCPISDSIDLTLDIKNQGLSDTLYLDMPVVSGALVNEISIIQYDTIVLPRDSGTLVIRFMPTISGVHNGLISIGNTDLNEDPYHINLYAVGGMYANEPLHQPSSISFSNVRSYTLNVRFTPVNPAPEGYLVLRQTGDPVTDIPVDGVSYQVGDVVGSAKVAYVGTDSSFTPNDIIANTSYHFAAFAFNGKNEYTNYCSEIPAHGVQQSGTMNIGSYYAGINSNDSASFISNLKSVIRSPYQQIDYGDYATMLVNGFYERDTTDGYHVINGSYNNRPLIYKNPFDWTTYGFSREHVFPKSWMPGTNVTTATREGSDIHNLIPVHQDSANAVRSNYPFGIVQNVEYSWHGVTFGTDLNGNNVFEPEDGIKGDLARALFYMCIMYDQLNGESWGIPRQVSNYIPYGQDQDLLKRWHWEDPPNNMEMARNDYIQSIQQNRNPFIDSMHFACVIDFYSVAAVTSPGVPCTTTSEPIPVQDHVSGLSRLEVLPNPVVTTGQIFFHASRAGNGILMITDSTGRMIRQESIQVIQGQNRIIFDTEALFSGSYMISIRLREWQKTSRFIRR